MDKPTEHTIETAGAAPRRSKRARMGACCKKFWWAWLIFVIIAIGIAAVILIFAIIPKIAQDKVNEADLTIHGLEIRQATPDSYKLSMDSSIHTGYGIGSKARIEPMTASLYIDSKKKPFLKVPVGEVHGKGDVPVVQEDYPVTIDDMDAMDQFVKGLMDNSTINFKLSGRSKLWLGKINTMINYNEDIELKGLNKLEGMVIKAYDILSKQADGSNMGGKVLIPNPTVFTIEMGNVGLKIGVSGKHAGIGYLPNLVLTPGNNLYDFRANISDLNVMIGALTAGTPLTIGSNGTMVNGEKIEWLSKPLESMDVLVPIDVSH
ncbi:hypothetical protein EX30DRAFT_305281 [Ascodesmis nigricans]|uniref:Uncharacterized protein n=1 Tax=Ascodesmis nigricans TaxID=341454 RepID=A0A4V3SJ45_9PEZI|nr:hypothetical protein EX30DRAFT_305281 [Ascodesmis nigricans]